MSDQGLEYAPTYPSHPDYDIYDYFYVFTYDFTVDPISVHWKSDRKKKERF